MSLAVSVYLSLSLSMCLCLSLSPPAPQPIPPTRIQVLTNCSDHRAASQHHLPINSLRRAAVSAAPSDLVLYADIDFIPSTAAHARIIAYYTSAPDPRVLLVLPCFSALPSFEWQPEIFFPEGEKRSVDVDITVSPVDLSKERLMAAVKEEQISPNHATADEIGHSHGATNYPVWFSIPASAAPYQAYYTLWYEPYFVINTSSWSGTIAGGLFSEIFFYGGGDKAQLAWEASSLGYAFVVHPGV
jgi:hypothetical protein